MLKGRWVDVDKNKGCKGEPLYRSRYVAKEIKHGAKSSLVAEFFAAMPPCLLFEDVADYCDDTAPPARRRICVELPPEMNMPDCVGLLRKSLYGTRDAPSNWEAEIRRVLCDVLSFTCGRASPCNFYLGSRCLRVTLHGDDFETLGPKSSLDWFEARLREDWELECKGIFGPPGLAGTVQEMKHLNRTLKWDADGITWEPGPRHCDILLREIDVTSRKVTSPLVKEKLEEDEADEPWRRRTLSGIKVG